MYLFSVFTYAAKNSAFNLTEYAWSMLSKKLSDILISKFDENSKPLAMKSDVGNKEWHMKEKLCLTKLIQAWGHIKSHKRIHLKNA